MQASHGHAYVAPALILVGLHAHIHGEPPCGAEGAYRRPGRAPAEGRMPCSMPARRPPPESKLDTVSPGGVQGFRSTTGAPATCCRQERMHAQAPMSVEGRVHVLRCARSCHSLTLSFAVFARCCSSSWRSSLSRLAAGSSSCAYPTCKSSSVSMSCCSALRLCGRRPYAIDFEMKGGWDHKIQYPQVLYRMQCDSCIWWRCVWLNPAMWPPFELHADMGGSSSKQLVACCARCACAVLPSTVT